MNSVYHSDSIKRHLQLVALDREYLRWLRWTLFDSCMLILFTLNLQRVLLRLQYYRSILILRPLDSLTSWTLAEWIIVAFFLFLFFVHFTNFCICFTQIRRLKYPMEMKPPIAAAQSPSPMKSTSPVASSSKPTSPGIFSMMNFSIQKTMPSAFSCLSPASSSRISSDSWMSNSFNSSAYQGPDVPFTSPPAMTSFNYYPRLPNLGMGDMSYASEGSGYWDGAAGLPHSRSMDNFIPSIMTSSPRGGKGAYQVATHSLQKPQFVLSHGSGSNLSGFNYEAAANISAVSHIPLIPVSDSQYWTENRVTLTHLDRWTLSLRKWVNNTIIRRIVNQIDFWNSQPLAAFGSNDIKIGDVSLDTLRQICVAQQQSGQYSGLLVLIRFLDLTPDQSYLVNRLRELHQSSCMRDFRWNAGSVSTKAPWKEHLPNDSTIILHLFMTYLNTQLPWEPGQSGFGTFSQSRFVTCLNKNELTQLDGAALYEVCKQPPQLKVVRLSRLPKPLVAASMVASASISGQLLSHPGWDDAAAAPFGNGDLRFEDLSNGTNNASGVSVERTCVLQYNITEGGKNVFHAILLLLHYILTHEAGRISGIQLNSSGLNVAWIFDS